MAAHKQRSRAASPTPDRFGPGAAPNGSATFMSLVLRSPTGTMIAASRSGARAHAGKAGKR